MIMVPVPKVADRPVTRTAMFQAVAFDPAIMEVTSTISAVRLLTVSLLLLVVQVARFQAGWGFGNPGFGEWC